MLKKHYSLVSADKVLEIINSDPRMATVDAILKHFQNGREQGYIIQQFGMKYMQSAKIPMRNIAFAMNRSSDQIAVYIGPEEHQGVSDKAWKNGRYFETVEEAAEYIIQEAVKFDEEEKRVAI